MKIKGDRSKARIRQRQEEALQRQEVHDKRTHQQQLELIKTRPGESKNEKHRVAELIKEALEKAERKKK